MGPKGSMFEGKTLDDAVRKGLEALGMSRAEVMINVVEEGSGGFLGFGARPYKVIITPRPGGPPRDDDDRDRERRGGRGRREGGREGGRRGRGEGRSEGRGERNGRTRRSGESRGGERGRGERRGDRERRGGRRQEERAEPRETRAPREPREPREAREPRPAPPATEAVAGGPEEGGADRRRRRRGRRGGRGRRGERRGAPVEAVAGAPAPVEAVAAPPGEWEQTDAPVTAAATAPEPEPARAASMEEAAPAPAAREEAPAPSVAEPSGGEGMDDAALAESGKRWTEDLLKAMGFEAKVSAVARDERVDVTVEVAERDDLLTGPKGEVRQAMQQLLNRMVNRGEGSRYHLQLEINDFWARREEELRQLARDLAREALEKNDEVVTEYLNAQERRIVHVTLRDDERVKTYSLGSGMIKRLAIAPAGFDEGQHGDD